jgi:hypothetical protein
LIAMACGAWIRAMTPPLVAAGGELSFDPFGLFAAEGEGDRLPYNPAVLQAIQDSGKMG